MRIPSVFLSHSSKDHEFVVAVATELGRLGVVSWLDRLELPLGQDLVSALPDAIRKQTALALFLSEKAASSDWVRDELVAALEAGKENEHLILPVFLGNPLPLVKSVPILRQHWLHADGDRVKKLGFVADLGVRSSQELAKEIATKIAERLYQTVAMNRADELIIHLDQRGTGTRVGLPRLPRNLEELDVPCLSFRPDAGQRSYTETLTGEPWLSVSQQIHHALALGLNNHRPSKVRLVGEAQLGLHYAVGMFFDRTTGVDLYCYHRTGDPFTNRGQIRHTVLPNGAPDGKYDWLTRPGDPHSPICSLGIFSRWNYASDAHTFMQGVAPHEPFVWYKSIEQFENSQQAMALVADIVALVQQLRTDHAVEQIRLFASVPTHVLALLAANLTEHVTRKVIFMEFVKGIDATRYEHLPMP